MALVMFVVTMSVITVGRMEDPSTVPGSYLSALWGIGFNLANSGGAGVAMLTNTNLFSGTCIIVFVVGGVLVSKRRGLPVFRVQRPGMDQLYLELPKEVS